MIEAVSVMALGRIGAPSFAPLCHRPGTFPYVLALSRQQAGNAITRGRGGTGLGLAISKRIIEMHGGKIWIESQIGQGPTAFTLPVHVEQQVEAA